MEEMSGKNSKEGRSDAMELDIGGLEQLSANDDSADDHHDIENPKTPLLPSGGRSDAMEGDHEQLSANDGSADHHDTENPKIPLLTSVRKKLDRWSESPLLSSHSIYKVPKPIFNRNKSAYIPRVVSVGPIHHGRSGLEAMEEYKQRFFLEFLQRTEISLEDYFVFIKKREVELRNRYADIIEFGSDKLVEIVMVDAAFVVMLLVKSAEEYQENCRIFSRPYHLMNIQEDMLFLENQLPLFILEDVFNYSNIKVNTPSSSEDDEGPDKENIKEEEEKDGKEEEEDEEQEGGKDDSSFIKLVCKFINVRGDLGVKEYDIKKVKNRKIEHFLHCLRVSHLSSKVCDSSVKAVMENISIPTITELHQAGVRFAKSLSTHLFDIEFKDGVLWIPRIRLTVITETIYRNLLAFEHCHYIDELWFVDFFALMDQLINSSQDIDLLVNSGIITNSLGDSGQAADVFNRLAQGFGRTSEFHFAYLCEQLRAYYKVRCHKWKATLKQDYFNTPWSIISVIAAVILLVLTFVQTMFSVIS